MASANNQAADLPPDNAARIAIFDAMHEPSGAPSVSQDELFERVIGRLRVLVPRELHIAGERAYVQQKVQACMHAGLLTTVSENGDRHLTLSGRPPLVRYPDGVLRDYPPGLEPARERLDGDNARLRSAGFDVRRFIPTSADDVEGPEFRGLLESMREHGFLRQFPILRHEDGEVIDGRARLRAAAILGLDVEYLKDGSEREQALARRRDTPLKRMQLAIHCNLLRLDPEAIRTIHDAVADVTRRPWSQTADDLALTAAWRQAIPPEYSPQFEVRKLAFRDGEEPKVQVTPDGKVMLRSLVEAAGLSNYKIDALRDYVPFERARSVHSAGRKAVFARADDLIAGIGAMQHDRREYKRKLDPEWEQIRDWLTRNFQTASPPQDPLTPEPGSG